MKKSLFEVSWRPAEMSMAQANRSWMGQAGASSILPLIETPELSSAVDFTATAASAFLAYAAYKTSHPTMGLVWALVSVGAGMKFLHDLSKL